MQNIFVGKRIRFAMLNYGFDLYFLNLNQIRKITWWVSLMKLVSTSKCIEQKRFYTLSCSVASKSP